jgi:hypothetical protein
VNSIITVISGFIFIAIGLTSILKSKSFAMKLFKLRCKRKFSIQQRIQGFSLLSLIVGILCFFVGGFSVYKFFILEDFIGFVGGTIICILSAVWLKIGIKVWTKASTSSYEEESFVHFVNQVYPIFYLIFGVCTLLGVGLILRLFIMLELPRIFIFRLAGVTLTLGFIAGMIFIFLSWRSIIKRFDFYHYLLIQQQRVGDCSLQTPILILGIGVTLIGIFLIIISYSVP